MTAVEVTVARTWLSIRVDLVEGGRSGPSLGPAVAHEYSDPPGCGMAES